MVKNLNIMQNRVFATLAPCESVDCALANVIRGLLNNNFDALAREYYNAAESAAFGIPKYRVLALLTSDQADRLISKNLPK